MRTLKNYAMALVALVIAATSVTLMSFGENGVNSAQLQDLTYYVLNPETDEYENVGTTPPDIMGNCAPGGDHKCVIGYETDRGTNLDPNALPDDPDFESDDNGWFITP